MLDIDFLKLCENIKDGIKQRAIPFALAGVTLISLAGCSNSNGITTDEQITALIEENERLRRQNELLIESAQAYLGESASIDIDVSATAIAGNGTSTSASTSKNGTTSSSTTTPSTPISKPDSIPCDEDVPVEPTPEPSYGTNQIPPEEIVDIWIPERDWHDQNPPEEPEKPNRECFYYGDKIIYADFIGEPIVLTSSDGMVTTNGTYREIISCGVKYLVDSNCCVVAAGYDNLGTLYYMQYYDPAYGGRDSSRGLPGYVLRTYEDNGTFSCLDADTFAPVLTDCNTYGVIDYFYIEAYDPAYGGRDNTGAGAGWVYVIYKDGIQYMVDANDFSRVLECGFDSFTYGCDEHGRATITFTYPNGCTTTYYARDFRPSSDNILTR